MVQAGEYKATALYKSARVFTRFSHNARVANFKPEPRAPITPSSSFATMNRQSLEAMKRIDIQKLCKDYGVRANLKTEALIDLLLDASQPRQPKQAPIPPAPQRAPSTRRASSRAGLRTRGISGGSVIIHDSGDEEEEESPVEPPPEPQHVPEPESEPETLRPPPRTRKAKEMQLRLGVGRPVLAGGSGARAVTKSVSVAKGKRGKSRSIKLSQETIQEETEPEPLETIAESEPPEAKNEEYQVNPLLPNTVETSLASLELIDKHVAEALKPLHTQLQALKSEVDRLKAQESEVNDLKLKVQTLTAQVEGLRSESSTVKRLEAEVIRLKNSTTTSLPVPRVLKATPIRSASPSDSSENPFLTSKSLSKTITFKASEASANASGSQAIPPRPTDSPLPGHPGAAPSMLGKRHRDSTGSGIVGTFDAGGEEQVSEAEGSKKSSRPSKKRARLDLDDEGADDSSAPGLSAQAQPPRIPSFTIYSDPSPSRQSTSHDPPPPTAHLPDFFEPPSPPSIPLAGPSTSTALASENQNPFSFSFLTSSTPIHPLYPMSVPSFPYPEPPLSPSPSGPRHHEGNPFDTSPPRSRHTPSSGFGGESNAATFVNPAMLQQSSEGERRRDLSSNEVAAGLGLTTVKTSQPEGVRDTGPVQKTMYGTELEDDKRFGDFGVEGVAAGFWVTGGGPC